jgi:hypothetical protein
MTRACSCTAVEKQIVLRTKRFMRVRNVRCWRAICCVCRLPGLCTSGARCRREAQHGVHRPQHRGVLLACTQYRGGADVQRSTAHAPSRTPSSRAIPAANVGLAVPAKIVNASTIDSPPTGLTLIKAAQSSSSYRPPLHSAYCPSHFKRGLFIVRDNLCKGRADYHDRGEAYGRLLACPLFCDALLGMAALSLTWRYGVRVPESCCH